MSEDKPLNDEQLKDRLIAELDKDIGPLTKRSAATRPQVLPQVGHPPSTLNEQGALLERVDRELRDQIRRERLAIMADHQRSLVEIEIAYNEKISNTTAMLEGERQDALAKLADRTNAKLREHDLLTKRMG